MARDTGPLVTTLAHLDYSRRKKRRLHERLVKLGIANDAWRRAATIGKVDYRKITKHRKERLFRATEKLVNPLGDWEYGGASIDYGESDWQSPELVAEVQRIHLRGLHERAKQAEKLRIAISELSSHQMAIWENRELYEERQLMAKSADLLDRLSRELDVVALGYERLKKRTPKRSSQLEDMTFSSWVWEVATAFNEAGGLVTLTKPGSGGQDNYSSSFFEFTLALMRDIPGWSEQTAPKAFGARLDRALSELRQVKTGLDGRTYVILSKGKILRPPAG